MDSITKSKEPEQKEYHLNEIYTIFWGLTYRELTIIMSRSSNTLVGIGLIV